MEKMKKFVIIGGGGLAKEMRFLLKQVYQKKINFLGYIDFEKKTIQDKTVIGNDEWLLNVKFELNVVFGIGNPKIIKELSEKYIQNKNLIFPNIIHPNVIGDFENIKIGKGNIISAGNIFTTDIEIGDFNIFNLNSTIGHDTKIGNYNIFNPTTNISGFLNIGNCCLFGTGCQILERLNIVDNSIIGGGAVVNKSINEENGVYVGIPFKKIK